MLETSKTGEKQKDDTTEFMDGFNYTGDKGPCFGTRHTQIVLMAIGSGLATATRTTFTIILISMTTADTSSNENVPVYDWNNMGVLIGAVLWSGIPVQIIAGYLGKRWGPKWLTLGISITNAIFFMLIPVFASVWGSVGVIFCRVVQGAAQGGVGPLGAVINGLWVPADERSKAGLISAVGNMGIIMAFSMLTGLIAASSLGWPWCIYILGIAELLWCILWLFLAHQNPQSHPGITPEEKKYIETSLSQRETKDIPTPWLKIITSIHFWAIILASMGTDWVNTMMSASTSIFIVKVLEIDVQTSSIYMSVAPLVGVASGMIIAPLSDFLIKRNIVRCVNARRLFHTIGTVGNALILISMTYLIPGLNMALIVLNFCISNSFVIMYSVGGATVNALDISPVFCGVISGVAWTFSQAFALFAPLSIDWIVHDNTSAVQWRTIYIITAGITLVTTLFFDIFATDKRQVQWEGIDESIKDENQDKSVNKSV